MEQLGAYLITKSFSNQNAGYSLWGFADKGGKEYFIKQFVERKYPANDTVSSPERLKKKKEECYRFEQTKENIYRTLNNYSDGNAVRVEEFFRVESKYYVAMQKINAVSMSVSDIANLTKDEIRRICAVIAHSIANVHKGGLIHADLKPDNILFTRTSSGKLTAKIIDFDSSFLETAPPAPGEAIIGDFHYFSPEACKNIWGESVSLTCQMDVFALGVLFHQYFTGALPGYNTKESSYSGEAVAKGEKLVVSDRLPADISELLISMLDGNPQNRPTAMEVFYALRGINPGENVNEVVSYDVVQEYEYEPVINESTTKKNPFFRPGDL
jgi:serine/threonine protein kinase